LSLRRELRMRNCTQVNFQRGGKTSLYSIFKTNKTNNNTNKILSTNYLKTSDMSLFLNIMKQV
jgi:hypothetical protein